MSLNSKGGSTLQWDAGRGLMCSHQLFSLILTVDNFCHWISYAHRIIATSAVFVRLSVRLSVTRWCVECRQMDLGPCGFRRPIGYSRGILTSAVFVRLSVRLSVTRWYVECRQMDLGPCGFRRSIGYSRAILVFETKFCMYGNLRWAPLLSGKTARNVDFRAYSCYRRVAQLA